MSAQPAAGELFWKSRRWWKRLGQTSFAAWISTALAFLASVIAARALGPTEFGEVILALSAATLAGHVLDLTLEQAVVFHGLRLRKAGQIKALRRLVRTSLGLDLVIGVLVAAFVIGLADPVADLISGGELDPNLLRLAAVSVLLATIDGTTGALIVIADRPDLRAWVMAGASGVRLVAIAVALGLGGGMAEVVLAYVLASAAGAIAQAFIAWRIAWRPWRRLSDAGGGNVTVRELSSFAAHTSLATSLYSGRDLLIPVILGSIVGPAAVGLFRVALFPVIAAGLLSAPLRILLVAEQNKLHADGRFQELWDSIKFHFTVALAVGIPVGVIGWFVLELLIPTLYTDAFEPAVTPARILLIAAVMHLAGSWWKTLPAAIGRPKLSSVSGGISLAVMIGLLALFAGLEAEGAALAYSLETVILGSGLLVYARHVLRSESRNAIAAAEAQADAHAQQAQPQAPPVPSRA